MRALGVVLFGLLCAAPAVAAETSQLLIGIGQYDIIPDDKKSAALHIQYRFADGLGGGKFLGGKFLGFKPLIGGFINADEGAFGFVGVAAPIAWGRRDRFEFEPSVGIGAYHQGDSTFLGGVAQFHLGMQFSAKVTRSWRAGIGLTHVSNGTILHKKNRGTNILMATTGWDF